jgi:hypothetical protein
VGAVRTGSGSYVWAMGAAACCAAGGGLLVVLLRRAPHRPAALTLDAART